MGTRVDKLARRSSGRGTGDPFKKPPDLSASMNNPFENDLQYCHILCIEFLL